MLCDTSVKAISFFETKLVDSIKSGVNILGLSYDETACFRKGTRLGPSAIREVSDGLESYSSYQDLDLTDYEISDCGDVENDNSWPSLEAGFLKKVNGVNFKNVKLLTLGGEHSISFLPIREYLKAYPELLIVHLDAHADLRDGHEGFKYSHASIMFRSMELFGKGHSVLQYGIRSGTREEFLMMKKKETICNSLEELLSRIGRNNKPIYLTLDVDFFDPSIVPGTGTPEAGGECFSSFIKILKLLKTKNVVGADCVELAPNIDSTGNSSVFVSLIVRELLLLLGGGK